MAQKISTDVLKCYNIIPPAVRNAITSHLLQESGIDIQEGIPALYTYSERYRNDRSLKKAMTTAILLHLIYILKDLNYSGNPVCVEMNTSSFANDKVLTNEIKKLYKHSWWQWLR